MGRPTKFTPELSAEIVELVEQGAPVETCAAACGLSHQTLYNWMDWGIAGREGYAEFFDAVTRARARVEIRLLHRVLGEEEDPDVDHIDPERQAQALRQWHSERAKGAAWLLERTRPGQYAQRVNLKVNQAVSEVMEVVRGLCTPADFARICERLASGDREGRALPSGELESGEGLDS